MQLEKCTNRYLICLVTSKLYIFGHGKQTSRHICRWCSAKAKSLTHHDQLISLPLSSLNSLRNYLLKRGLLANFARNRTLNARSRQYISWWCNWKNIVRGIKLHEKGLVIIATQIFSSESFLWRTHIHLSLKSDVFISVQKDWIFATDFVQKLLKEKVFINQI